MKMLTVDQIHTLADQGKITTVQKTELLALRAKMDDAKKAYQTGKRALLATIPGGR